MYSEALALNLQQYCIDINPSNTVQWNTSYLGYAKDF